MNDLFTFFAKKYGMGNGRGSPACPTQSQLVLNTSLIDIDTLERGTSHKSVSEQH
jgi:hypothetical protein